MITGINHITITSKILLKPFDTIIKRGIYHAWSNRSSEDCLMVYLLLDVTL
jgi:hypothetical protein